VLTILLFALPTGAAIQVVDFFEDGDSLFTRVGKRVPLRWKSASLKGIQLT
jgi:hypothetical protein